MATYCGVDFHARQQTVYYCDTADGVIHCQELHHDKDDVRGFYSQFTGRVIVGLEASGYSTWFAELLEGLGHQVWLGDATEIRRRARRRQKNDRRDAELILDLLLREDFPQVHRPSLESREVLRLLRYRHRLVQMRTRCKNSLQALAFSAGLAQSSVNQPYHFKRRKISFDPSASQEKSFIHLAAYLSYGSLLVTTFTRQKNLPNFCAK